MKIALVLTGYMRNWKYNFPYIKKEIINPYLPDIFITSYTYSKFYWSSEREYVNTKEVIDTYKPKNFLFREEETCPEFNFKENKLEKIGRDYSIRQLYGWYTNYLSLKLFDPSVYDIIIKLRTDIALRNFHINFNSNLTIPAWKIHPGHCSPEESLIDYFAYGNSDCMKKYFELYTKMQEMYDKNTADISLGETLLKNYVDQYIGIENVNMDIETDWNLRGEIWETDKVKFMLNCNPKMITALTTEMGV